MTRDEKIKEVLYDLDRAKGDYDEIESLLLGFAGITSEYKMLAEFQISDDDDAKMQDKFEEELFSYLQELYDAGNEPDMMKMSFFKKVK